MFDKTKDIPSPCFVIETEKLKQNLEVLKQLKDETGVRILFAQKAFATHAVYPLIAEYLDGVCASGLWEAKLGKDKFNGEVHTYSPAYRDDEIEEIFSLSHTVIFNSASQLACFQQQIRRHKKETQIGIRVNPECSVTTTPLYDPCAANSRLGIQSAHIGAIDFAMIDGLHFHALCEQNSIALEKVLGAVEEKFKTQLNQVQWLNMGGGHFVTQQDYDTEHFVKIITAFQKRHPHLQLYMEPGGAVVLNAGVLVATVLDVLEHDPPTALLDISCTCHTPDVLEMPYRPSIQNEVSVDEAPFCYQLGGISCLAGDVFGTYGFNTPLRRGDKVIFEDMAQYSIVKTTMFNGVRHPSIAVHDNLTSTINIVRNFSFVDYFNRL